MRAAMRFKVDDAISDELSERMVEVSRRLARLSRIRRVSYQSTV
jgi:hypothetical protein